MFTYNVDASDVRLANLANKNGGWEVELEFPIMNVASPV
jgi:hypothetical protein